MQPARMHRYAGSSALPHIIRWMLVCVLLALPASAAVSHAAPVAVVAPPTPALANPLPPLAPPAPATAQQAERATLSTPDQADTTPFADPYFGNLGVSFLPNTGRFETAVQFVAQGGSGSAHFTTTGVDFTFHDNASTRLRFLGTSGAADVTGAARNAGVVNDFRGNDPAAWQAGLPTYGSLVYRDLYTGIDMRYDGQDGVLKSTYTVAPGSTPDQIRWEYAGATTVQIDAASGDLLVHVPVATASGEQVSLLTEQAPIAWQTIEGRVVPVAVRYRLLPQKTGPPAVGFDVGSYDPAYPLLIDPALLYSTYLGGEGPDAANDIAVDVDGNVYVIGFTDGITLTDDSAQNPIAGGRDVFIAKLNNTGTELLYVTYLGGAGTDVGQGIAINDAGEAFIVGETNSDDLAIVGAAFQNSPASGGDAFLSRLDGSGNLIYSSYLGGSSLDRGNAIALDDSGAVYITGRTASNDFPIEAPAGGSVPQASATTGPDAFLTRIVFSDSSTAAIDYSTYLGGEGTDEGTSLSVSPDDVVYVGGFTESTSFPIFGNVPQTIFGGGFDAFLTGLEITNTNELTYTYSTFLGGNDQDRGYGIDTDTDGNIYLTGGTFSADFPTFNALQETLVGGVEDGFVTKYVISGSTVLTYSFSTYLGGSGSDEANGIVVDEAQRIYVTGYSASNNFPQQKPPPRLQRNLSQDAFITAISTTGQSLIYSTYLGGGGDDVGNAIAIANNNGEQGVYIAGATDSEPAQNLSGFPLGPLSRGGQITPLKAGKSPNGTDAFIANIGQPYLFVFSTTREEDETDPPEQRFRVEFSAYPASNKDEVALIRSSDDITFTYTTQDGTFTRLDGTTVVEPEPRAPDVPYADPELPDLGSATVANNDYIAATETVSVAADTANSFPVSITVIADLNDEFDEGLWLQVRNPINARFAELPDSDLGLGIIEDDEPLVSIEDASVVEGDPGDTVNAVISVTLSATSVFTSRVGYATEDMTAQDGIEQSTDQEEEDEDYIFSSGEVYHPINTRTVTFTVPITPDNDDEFATEFFVARLLEDAVGIGLDTDPATDDVTATVTIIDDDPTVVQLSDAAAREGDGIIFGVTLDSPADFPVTLIYSTVQASGLPPFATAEQGVDYQPVTNTVTIPAQSTREVSIRINSIEDNNFEADEDFWLHLLPKSPPDVQLPTEPGVGSILNDDEAPGISIADASVVEADSGTRPLTTTLTLAAASSFTITVDYRSEEGTARTLADYLDSSGEVVFPPGVTSQVITLTTLGDVLYEGSAETFRVLLDNAQIFLPEAEPATIADGEGIMTIEENEAIPPLIVNDSSLEEGDDGTVVASLSVELRYASVFPSSVDFATAEGGPFPATEDDDYLAAAGTLDFIAGETLQTIDLTINSDTLPEDDETFLTVLSNPNGLQIEDPDSQALVTILNDDGPAARFTQELYTVDEDAGTATITVTLSEPAAQPIEIDYFSFDVTTRVDADYNGDEAEGTLTFPVGSTSQSFTLSIVDDDQAEGDEVLVLSLGDIAGGAVLGQPSITSLVIVDDNVPDTGLLQLSAASYRVAEDTPQETATITVTRSGAADATLTVDYTTVDLTAAAGSDYRAASDTLTFGPGETVQTFTIPIIDDAQVEGNEDVLILLSNATGGAQTGRSAATLTILENDTTAAGTLQFSRSDYQVSEAGGVAIIGVERVGGSAGAVSVVCSASDSSATAGSDYDATTTTLLFQDGQTSGECRVPILEDPVVEGNETVSLELRNATGGATLGTRRSATLTIFDNDFEQNGILQFSVASSSATEGQGSALITVSRLGGTSDSVSVDYASSAGSATPGSDYTNVNGTLDFAPGETSQTFSLTVNDDTLALEGSETVNLTLSNPTGGATLGSQSSSTLVIVDDEPRPTLRLDAADYEVGESDPPITIRVLLSQTAAQTITVNYATSDGSATSGSDYSAAIGTLEFVPGTTEQSFSLSALPDTLVEGDETVNLALSNALPAGQVELAPPASATITILEDDSAANGILQFAAATYQVDEDTGTGEATLTVERIGNTNGSVSVAYSTLAGSASADSDYADQNGRLTFGPGESSQRFTLPITDDSEVEGLETVLLLLRDVQGGADLGAQSSAILEILDDDSDGSGGGDDSAGVVQFSASDYRVSEGGGFALISVQRTGGFSGTVQVVVNVSAGSATPDSDYTTPDVISRTLVFFGDTAARTLEIPILEDGTAEPDETINLRLGLPTGGATLGGRSSATLTIDDDDENNQGRLQFSQPDYRVNEGDGSILIRVERVGGTAGSLEAVLDTLDGTALAGSDYTRTAATLTFAPGETVQTVSIPILEDAEVESNETFLLTLRESGADTPLLSSLVTILDNDTPQAPNAVIQFAEATYAVQEDNGNATITVLRAGGFGQPVSVDYGTTDGSATAGSDYTNRSGRLTFGPQQDRIAFTVPILEDTTVEGAETLNLVLSNPGSGAVLGGQTQATLTIDDNDSPPNQQGTIQFAAASYSANENGDVALITVERIGGTAGSVQVDYETLNNTALAGSDYTFSTGTLTFADGQAQATFAVPLLEDSIVEGDERVRLRLSNVQGGATLGSRSSADLFILDDDTATVPAGTLQFTLDTYFINEDGTSATMTVVRTGSAEGSVSVQYTTFDDTATEGADYTRSTGTLTFADGEEQRQFTVPILEDTLPEGDETVLLSLDNVTGGATLGTRDRAVLIISDNDDDDQPQGVFQFSRSDYIVRENIASKLATMTVERIGGNAGEVTIDYTVPATPPGSATADSDYTAQSGTLTFGDGVEVMTFTIEIIEDSTPEGDETVNMLLSNPTGGAVLGTQQNATLTIQDDDAPEEGVIEFATDAYIVSEDDGSATIRVVRSGGTRGTVRVAYRTTDDSAVADADYLASNGTLVFAPGETSQTFTVTVVDDLAQEATESLNLLLDANSVQGGAVVGAQRTAQLFIVDDNDPTPAAQFGSDSYTVSETDDTATIDVELEASSVQPVTVSYVTLDRTATSSRDYTAVAGDLTFAPGETRATFTVPILEDDLVEGNETVNLLLTNGTLGARSQALLTIEDDDLQDQSLLQFSAATYSTSEDAGTAVITVDRIGNTDGEVSIRYDSFDLTALAGSDYETVSDTLTIGDGETSGTFSIPILEDSAVEGTETLQLKLSNVGGNAVLGSQDEALLLIEDNDATPAGVVLFDTLDYVVNETGTAASITVLRQNGVQGRVMVDVRSFDQSATAGADYQTISETLVFEDGETLLRFTIPITDDTLVEGRETVRLELSNATGGATLGTQNATILTIIDDDADTVPQGVIQFTDAQYFISEDGILARISVERVGGTDGTVGVRFDLFDGTAELNRDYVGLGSTLVFEAGSTEQVFTVSIIEDSLLEGDETIRLSLSNPTGGAVLGSLNTAELIIQDNDGSGFGVFQFRTRSYTVNEDDGTATITVDRVGGTTGSVSVDYTTVDDIATAGDDYLPASGTLTFEAGEASRSFTIGIQNDEVIEGNETLNIELSNATGGAALGSQRSSVLTIIDDDVTAAGLLQFSSGDYNVNEEAGSATISVVRLGGNAVTATVEYATAPDTAQPGSDYQTITGTLTFTPGETLHTFTVPILDNEAEEPDEQLGLVLSNATEASLGALNQATLTIRDDDAPPALTLEDVRIDEGNSGLRDAVFTLRLSNPSGLPVSVDFTTSDGSATVADNDYQPRNGRITVPPGQATRTITVAIVGDLKQEADETFFLNLSNPNNATLADGLAVGTIVDDGDPPLVQLSAASYRAPEDSGSLPITITLSAPFAEPVTVTYAIEDITTTAGEDYRFPGDPLVIPAGESETAFILTIVGDQAFETDETARIVLTGIENGQPGSPQQADLVIADDDDPPVVSVNDATLVPEGDDGESSLLVFNVSLSAASSFTATVDYDTANDSATAGTDYASTSGTLTFVPGQVTQPVSVTVLGDTLDEVDETFLVTLDNPTGAVGGDVEGIGTITDDDGPALNFSSSDYQVNENGVVATIEVRLSARSPQPLQVSYSTQEGSATPGEDYTTTSGQLDFPVDTLTNTFTIPLLDDELIEGTEAFTVNLTAPLNGELGQAEARVTIADDEGQPTVNFVPATYDVNEGALTTTVTVELSSVSNQEITVRARSRELPNGANVISDYVSIETLLTFPPGTRVQSFTIEVVDDERGEFTEQYQLELFNASNAQLGDESTALVNILDDDDLFTAYLPLVRSEPVLSFAQSRYTVDEDVGTATLTVTISATPLNMVRIDYTTADATATAGTDYITASGTLTFTERGSKTIMVPIVDDDISESTEIVTVELIPASLSGPARLSNVGAELAIRDDDG